MLARSMTAVIACLFLLCASSTAFSQSSDSSEEGKSESSSKDAKKDDKSESGDEDKEAQKEGQQRKDLAKKVRHTTIMEQIGGPEGGSTTIAEAFEGTNLLKDKSAQPIRVSVGQPELGGDGTLDQKQFKRVTKRGASAVKRCLEHSFKKSKASAGHLSIEVTIDEKGRVVQAAVSDSDFDAATDCVTTSAKRWRFPRPEGGKVTAKTLWTVSLEDKD